MSTAVAPPHLRTTIGNFALAECRLPIGTRDLSILHTDAVLSLDQETRFLDDPDRLLPYGVVLWPAAIALAQEIATRADQFSRRTVLELGAGTGLPGIAASALGASVVQTDRSELAVHVCRMNGERNRMEGVECWLADWTEWAEGTRYDWIVGSDILYADHHHGHLRAIFEGNLAPGGCCCPIRTALRAYLSWKGSKGPVGGRATPAGGSAREPRPERSRSSS